MAATRAITVALQRSGGGGGTVAHELVGLFVVNGKKTGEKKTAEWHCLA